MGKVRVWGRCPRTQTSLPLTEEDNVQAFTKGGNKGVWCAIENPASELNLEILTLSGLAQEKWAEMQYPRLKGYWTPFSFLFKNLDSLVIYKYLLQYLKVENILSDIKVENILSDFEGIVWSFLNPTEILKSKKLRLSVFKVSLLKEFGFVFLFNFVFLLFRLTVSWELARSKKGVWKEEKVENEEAARDSGNQTNKSSIFPAEVRNTRKALWPARQPHTGLVQQMLSGWVRETDKTLISLSTKYRRWGCVSLIRNNREKLLTIISNGLPVFWQWAQQLVCQFLTKCKNNNNPLSKLLICPATFHPIPLRPRSALPWPFHTCHIHFWPRNSSTSCKSSQKDPVENPGSSPFPILVP